MPCAAHGGRSLAFASTLLASTMSLAPAAAEAPKVGDPPEAMNMRLVGINDLQARSAYQPTIHQPGRPLPSPMSAITAARQDVPQAGEPDDRSDRDQRHVDRRRHRSGEAEIPVRTFPARRATIERGGAQMTRVCDGRALPKGDPNAVYLLRTFGSIGHEIWNVADPGASRCSSHASSAALQGHAQELVGMRHRHRVPRLRRRAAGARRA